MSVIAKGSAPSGSFLLNANTPAGNLFNVQKPSILSTVSYVLWSANNKITTNGQVTCTIYNVLNNKLGTPVGAPVTINVSSTTKTLDFDFTQQQINLLAGSDNYAAIIQGNVALNLGQIPNTKVNMTGNMAFNGEIQKRGLEFTVTGSDAPQSPLQPQLQSIIQPQFNAIVKPQVQPITLQPTMSIFENPFRTLSAGISTPSFATIQPTTNVSLYQTTSPAITNEYIVAQFLNGTASSATIDIGKSVGNMFSVTNAGKLTRIVYPFRTISNDGYVSCSLYEVLSGNRLGRLIGHPVTIYASRLTNSFSFVFADQNIDILANNSYAAIIKSTVITFVLPQSASSVPSSFMNNSVNTVIYDFTVNAYGSQTTPSLLVPTSTLIPVQQGAGYVPYTPTTNPTTLRPTTLRPTTMAPTTLRPTQYVGPALNGLVMNLDAGNNRSYPGSGQIWTDTISGMKFTLMNNPIFTNGAIRFNSMQKQWAKSTAAAPFDVSVYTVEAWFKFDGNSTGNIITESWSYYDANGYTQDNAVNYYLGIKESKPNLGYHIGGIGTPEVNSSTTLSNNWTHIVGICNNENLKIYINGELKGTARREIDPPYNGTMPLNLMKEWSSDSILGGDLSVVRIYNRALSDSEISNNFNVERTKYRI